MNSLTTSLTTCRTFSFPIRRRFHEPSTTPLVLKPPPPARCRRGGVICMAEPYVITRLESAEKAWKELSVKLADPDVVWNPGEYQKLARYMAELDEVVSTFRRFNDCEKQLEETKALAKEDGNDEDMAEIIAFVIVSLSNEIKELEEKLKVLLLPSDPLDARNIMVEVTAGTGGDEAGLWAGDLVGSYVSEVQRAQFLEVLSAFKLRGGKRRLQNLCDGDQRKSCLQRIKIRVWCSSGSMCTINRSTGSCTYLHSNCCHYARG